MKGITFEYIWERPHAYFGTYRPDDPKQISTRTRKPPRFDRPDGTYTGDYINLVGEHLIIG